MSNIYVVPRDNPLILEVRVESDVMINGMPGISPNSLGEIKKIINNYLLKRNYKVMIIDGSGILYAGSGFLSKMLMCYEKAYSVGCKVYSLRANPRIYAQHILARLNELVPVYNEENSPKPEDYDSFFGFDNHEIQAEIKKLKEQVNTDILEKVVDTKDDIGLLNLEIPYPNMVTETIEEKNITDEDTELEEESTEIENQQVVENHHPTEEVGIDDPTVSNISMLRM